MNDISRPTPDSAIPLAIAPVRDVAAAVMVAPDGHYLMQLRDDFPGLHLADHWALFGGSIEPGETAETALRRELAEELTWSPREIYPLCVMVHAIWPDAPIHRLHFFVVPFTMDDHKGMVQCEGAGMALMTLAGLAAREKVAPWDFCAVQFHARHRTLFPERVTPDWLATR